MVIWYFIQIFVCLVENGKTLSYWMCKGKCFFFFSYTNTLNKFLYLIMWRTCNTSPSPYFWCISVPSCHFVWIFCVFCLFNWVTNARPTFLFLFLKMFNLLCFIWFSLLWFELFFSFLCRPATRISKKKVKINIHRPTGTRVVYDDEGNALPPLARLADTKSDNESFMVDQGIWCHSWVAIV